jgi:transposase
MLKRKMSQSDVARELSVSRQTVHLWAKQLAEANGAVGKLKAKTLGRPKRLDAEQRNSLSRMPRGRRLASGLSHRALDDQTRAEVGGARVRRRVQHFRRLGTAAQPWLFAAEAREAGHPARRTRHRAVEAQDMACAQKKALREQRTIVFIDESGLSEKCPVTRTWAPKGQTPIIQQSFTWKQMSAVAGLTWWRFYFRFFNGAIRSEQIIEFLTALRRQIKGRLLIIWDGVATHRSRLVRHWLEEQDGHIAVAALPPYAPELNPVEAIWAYLKKHEIVNLCLNTIAEVSDFARRRLKSMQRRPRLIQAFWKQAELAL